MKKKNNGGRRRQSSSVKQRDGVHLLSSRRAGKSAPPSTKPKRSRPEDELLQLLRSRGYRDFKTEYRFHGTRKWRFDFAWPEQHVAFEIEGGVWMRGRHVRPKGFIDDCEKYNAAQMECWRVYRVPVVKGWIDAAIGFIQWEKLS